jgi:hypothetical protein
MKSTRSPLNPLFKISLILFLCGTGTSAPRVVLGELFDGGYCPTCPNSIQAMDSMRTIHSRNELAILEYPVWLGSGSLFTQEGQNRWQTFYNQTGIPTTWFDGVLNQYSSTGSDTGDFQVFEGFYQARHDIPSPLRMTMDGYINDTDGHIETTIIVEDDLSGYDSLRFIFCVVEDSLYEEWYNEVDWHHHIVRDMVPDEAGEPISLDLGDTLVIVRDFAVDSSWDTAHMTVVAFVQDWMTREVLQAVDFMAGDICGDADGSGQLTPSDGYMTLNYLGNGPEPISCWVANVNGDSGLTPADGFTILNLFGSGPDFVCAPCELSL